MKLKLFDQDLSITLEAFEIALDLCQLAADLLFTLCVGLQQTDLTFGIIESLQPRFRLREFALDPGQSIQPFLQRLAVLS